MNFLVAGIASGYTTGSANNASMQLNLERAWVDIDLGALQRNGATIARLARVPLLPMIKADAYGLGAVRAARTLATLRPWGFGVATVDEGAELRDSGISEPIVVFTPLLPSDLRRAAETRLTPALSYERDIREWGPSGRPWHLSIDTGMSRAGISWRDVSTLVNVVAEFPPEGAFTHLHSAQLDDSSVDVQIERFNGAIAALGRRPKLLHCEASAAIVRAAPSRWDLVRPGIYMYGVGSGVDPQPEPVVHMRAAVVDIRTLEPGDTVSYDATYVAGAAVRVATVSAGYADGYPRALSNRSAALLNGETIRITGRVTMDMTMFDVTNVKCEIGDVVTLIGSSGGRTITLQQIADWADMSPYEVLTGFRGRIQRRYT